MVLITRNDFPASNLQEFIAYVKANGTKLQYGSAGVGSTTHLSCALLNAAAGINITHVPYRGGGPAMVDLMASHSITCAQQCQRGAADQQDAKGDRDIGAQSFAAIAVACNRARAGPDKFRSSCVERFLHAQGHALSDRQEAQLRNDRSDE
jgi:hypothetical protein